MGIWSQICERIAVCGYLSGWGGCGIGVSVRICFGFEWFLSVREGDGFLVPLVGFCFFPWCLVLLCGSFSVGVWCLSGCPGRSFCSHFLVFLLFARNEDSAQKAYKWLNQRNNNAGRLFFRVASEVPPPPENAELFARDH